MKKPILTLLFLTLIYTAQSQEGQLLQHQALLFQIPLGSDQVEFGAAEFRMHVPGLQALSRQKRFRADIPLFAKRIKKGF